MITVTLTAKCYFRGEFHRPGTTFQVSPDQYAELLAKGVIAEPEKKEVKPKKDKE